MENCGVEFKLHFLDEDSYKDTYTFVDRLILPIRMLLIASTGPASRNKLSMVDYSEFRIVVEIKRTDHPYIIECPTNLDKLMHLQLPVAHTAKVPAGNLAEAYEIKRCYSKFSRAEYFETTFDTKDHAFGPSVVPDQDVNFTISATALIPESVLIKLSAPWTAPNFTISQQQNFMPHQIMYPLVNYDSRPFKLQSSTGSGLKPLVIKYSNNSTMEVAETIREDLKDASKLLKEYDYIERVAREGKERRRARIAIENAAVARFKNDILRTRIQTASANPGNIDMVVFTRNFMTKAYPSPLGLELVTEDVLDMVYENTHCLSMAREWRSPSGLSVPDETMNIMNKLREHSVLDQAIRKIQDTLGNDFMDMTNSNTNQTGQHDPEIGDPTGVAVAVDEDAETGSSSSMQSVPSDSGQARALETVTSVESSVMDIHVEEELVADMPNDKSTIDACGMIHTLSRAVLGSESIGENSFIIGENCRSNKVSAERWRAAVNSNNIYDKQNDEQERMFLSPDNLWRSFTSTQKDSSSSTPLQRQFYSDLLLSVAERGEEQPHKFKPAKRTKHSREFQFFATIMRDVPRRHLELVKPFLSPEFPSCPATKRAIRMLKNHGLMVFDPRNVAAADLGKSEYISNNLAVPNPLSGPNAPIVHSFMSTAAPTCTGKDAGHHMKLPELSQLTSSSSPVMAGTGLESSSLLLSNTTPTVLPVFHHGPNAVAPQPSSAPSLQDLQKTPGNVLPTSIGAPNIQPQQQSLQSNAIQDAALDTSGSGAAETAAGAVGWISGDVEVVGGSHQLLPSSICSDDNDARLLSADSSSGGHADKGSRLLNDDVLKSILNNQLTSSRSGQGVAAFLAMMVDRVESGAAKKAEADRVAAQQLREDAVRQRLVEAREKNLVERQAVYRHLKDHEERRQEEVRLRYLQQLQDDDDDEEEQTKAADAVDTEKDDAYKQAVRSYLDDGGEEELESASDRDEATQIDEKPRHSKTHRLGKSSSVDGKYKYAKNGEKQADTRSVDLDGRQNSSMSHGLSRKDTDSEDEGEEEDEDVPEGKFRSTGGNKGEARGRPRGRPRKNARVPSRDKTVTVSTSTRKRKSSDGVAVALLALVEDDDDDDGNDDYEGDKVAAVGAASINKAGPSGDDDALLHSAPPRKRPRGRPRKNATTADDREETKNAKSSAVVVPSKSAAANARNGKPRGRPSVGGRGKRPNGGSPSLPVQHLAIIAGQEQNQHQQKLPATSSNRNRNRSTRQQEYASDASSLMSASSSDYES